MQTCITGPAASQPLCACTMTLCPPECVCQKDWPCCVIEAADSVPVAVLGDSLWATVLGCLVTEFPAIAFLTGPGLTHTTAARPVVTDTMDTATICQVHGVRSVTTKPPESTTVTAFCRSPTFLHNLLWHQTIIPLVLDRGISNERHPS